MTDTSQRNAVSEGFALGLLMCGLEALPTSNKSSIDLSFQGAWRSWPHRGDFPRVTRDLGGHGADPLYLITGANFRSRVFNLYWDTSSPRKIHRRDQWSDDLDFDAMAETISDLPAAEWKTLAEDFLARIA